jgi:hypothetical protein
MNLRSLSHLSNQELLRALAAIVAKDRDITAELIAHIAEVDDRRLYAQEGFPSMFAYCVRVLHASEDEAFKRIRAARTARQFPAILEAVADGRMHMTGVVFLAPYLTAENADELLAAASHKTKAEIEWMLAERFPRPDLPERVEVLAPSSALGEPVLSAHVTELPKSLVPEPVGCFGPRARMIPLSAERVALQTTIATAAYENLRYAQALLGHDLAGVIERASELIVREAEKQKFAASSRPHSDRHGSSADPRRIPAAVKRAVWLRDRGQCGFVSEAGQRCPATTRLEFDHVDPVARGGEATVENLRVRCRTHNQFEAECVFGAGFMAEKRAAAMVAREAARAEREAAKAERERQRAAAAEVREKKRVVEEEAKAQAAELDQDVVLALRGLQCRADEALAAAAHCASTLPPDATLEMKVRAALGYFRPKGVKMRPSAA